MDNKIMCHTFGFGHFNNKGGKIESLRNRYVRCTREQMFDITNGKFAFSYTKEGFKRRNKVFGLTEIKLSAIGTVI